MPRNPRSPALHDPRTRQELDNKQDRLRTVYRTLPKQARDGDAVIFVKDDENVFHCVREGGSWFCQRIERTTATSLPTAGGIDVEAVERIIADSTPTQPKWVAAPPDIEIRKNDPSLIDQVSFASAIEIGNIPIQSFEILVSDSENPEFGEHNSDGLGNIPSFRGLRDLDISIDAQNIAYDARFVFFNEMGASLTFPDSGYTIQYRIVVTTGEESNMARIFSNYAEIRVLQAQDTVWSPGPQALRMYEGLSYDYNFSSRLMLGVPPPASYQLFLARDINGNPVTDTDLFETSSAVPHVDDEFEFSIPGSGADATTARFNATGVTLSGTADKTLYYQLRARVPDGSGGFTNVDSPWTLLTILNQYNLTWGEPDDQEVVEGRTITFDISSVYTEGAPMTMTSDLGIQLSQQNSGTPVAITHAMLDDELMASISGTTVTINADAVSGLTSDQRVYYRLFADQPDPVNPGTN